jgi:3,4-dihydroxy 2-butanone 4-phosphate synthase / GTP cyclohydrolase II
VSTACEVRFAAVERALEELRRGRFVIVFDGEDDHAGYLTIAAQHVGARAVNFMATHGRGVICLCLTEERCSTLGLRQMIGPNPNPSSATFTVSIEAREGVSTGISARDRAHTIGVAIDPVSTASDLVSPGHVFPLRTRRGGVLERAAPAEAAVDLAWLAGLEPAGVVCAVMSDDGMIAGVSDLARFGRRHALTLIRLADLVTYRRRHGMLVRRVDSEPLTTRFGDFRAIGYREAFTGRAHVALVKGDVADGQEVPVHVHSIGLLRDVLHTRDRPGSELHDTLDLIGATGVGVIVCLTSALPDDPLASLRVDPGDRVGVSADEHEATVARQILADIGVSGCA